MYMIKEMVENNYTSRRGELFNILDKAITETIVERGIRFEPIDMSKQFNKYKGSLIADKNIKKEHS